MPERACGRRWSGGWQSPRFLCPTLLLLLHRGEAHGYTLLEQVQEFGLVLNPTPVYRQLREMEDQGWVTSDWDATSSQGPPRRVYRLTDAGDAALAQWVQELQATQQRIGQFIEAYHVHMAKDQHAHH